MGAWRDGIPEMRPCFDYGSVLVCVGMSSWMNDMTLDMVVANNTDPGSNHVNEPR